MNKYLSIVIPYYNETPEEIKPALDSINNQTGIRKEAIEVILVNDGNGNVLPEDMFKYYGLDIRSIMMPENRGPGIARQVGLDAAKGQYITFMDADDILFSCQSLMLIIRELEASQPDMLITSWIEEQRDINGYMTYLPHIGDQTWMFGKAFNVAFLRGNNIRFHEDLRVQEDSYFNTLAIEMARNARQLNEVTYVWRYREKSITRTDNAAYSFNSFGQYIRSAAGSITQLHERGYTKNLTTRTTQLILYSFFLLHREEWRQEDVKRYLIESEEALKELVTPYLNYFESMPAEEFKQLYSTLREIHFKGQLETEFFNDWLKRIGLTA